MTGAFVRRVAEGMRRRKLGLRELCRAARLDPSFFSKVLSGKRSPPSEEGVLRKLAGILELDAAELIVAAGRIPREWAALRDDASLFRSVNSRIVGVSWTALSPRPPAAGTSSVLSEELL